MYAFYILKYFYKNVYKNYLKNMKTIHTDFNIVSTIKTH